MKKKIFSLLALVMIAMTASAADPTEYDLTTGTCEQGTVSFKVEGTVVTKTAAGKTVHVTITPTTGWLTNVVTAKAYADWSGAKSRGMDVVNKINVEGSGNEYTFTMPEANVEVSATFKKLIQSSWISIATTSYVYDGTAKEPDVTVKDGDTTLPASAYSISYSNNTDAGNEATVTVSITAENQNYAGEASAVFTIDKATLTTVVLKDTLFTYTYSDITVSIASVKAGDLEVSADGYTLSGGTQKEVGSYTATVTGKGNFQGTVSAKYRIKESEPTVDVEANETANIDKEVENVTMNMTVADDAAEKAFTEERTVINEETGEEEQVEVTVIPVVLSNVSIPEQEDASEVNKKGVTVIVPSEIVDGNVVYKVTNITADAFKSPEGSDTEVNKVILPESTNTLEIEDGAMKPDGKLVEVVSPLALLDDYALMPSLKETFEANLIKATVQAPNKYWTFSSGVDCVLPEGVTAYKAIWEDNWPRIVPLEESDLILANGRRGIKANNGVLIGSEKGNAYEIVASPGNQASGSEPAKTDANSYEGNCLVPTIEATNYEAGKFLILKDNEFHTIKNNASKVKPCKAVFSLVKAKAN